MHQAAAGLDRLTLHEIPHSHPGALAFLMMRQNPPPDVVPPWTAICWASPPSTSWPLHITESSFRVISLAVGPDKNIWFTNNGRSQIGVPHLPIK